MLSLMPYFRYSPADCLQRGLLSLHCHCPSSGLTISCPPSHATASCPSESLSPASPSSMKPLQCGRDGCSKR